jgi:hypothetical protein
MLEDCVMVAITQESTDYGTDGQPLMTARPD